ncbi:unnamed protein product [Diamesa hyperborea]
MLLKCIEMCLLLAGINAVILPPNISDIEKNFIDILSVKILNSKLEIDLSKLATDSSQCYKDSLNYLNALKKFEFWALKMYDSSAKIPLGMLYGNVHSYGHFDECLDVVEPNKEFQGQYCLTTMQLTVAKEAPYLNYLRSRALSFEQFSSEINDTNHLAPSMSKIHWSFCVPSSCSPQDVETLLQSHLNEFTRDTVLSIKAYVDPKLCQVKESLSSKIDGSTIMTICFFGVLFILSILSSKFHSTSWLKAFSVSDNLTTLLLTQRHSSDISVIHGIRFICVMIIFLSHKMVTISFHPLFYRTSLVEDSTKTPVGLILKGAHIITDVFIMLSGFVASYILIEQSERMKRMPILGAYILKYLRMVPSVLIVMLIAAFILPLLGDGPLFPIVVNHNSQLCRANGWSNMLMLQNFLVPFSEMCLMFTYHVAVDFQLFLLVPFMVIILLKRPKEGTFAFVILIIIISIINFFSLKSSGYSKFVVVGTSYKSGNDYIGKNQSIPLYRFPVFAIGVLLGFYIKKCKMFELTKVQRFFGWTLAAGSLYGVFYNMHMMSAMDYKLNTAVSAFFTSFTPLVMCLIFGWVIFVAQLGDPNFLIKFLQWKGFIVTSNFSYSLFLVQFPILFFFSGTARAVQSYGVYSFTTANFEETLVIFLAAVSLTLFIEMPVKNLCNLLLKSKKREGKEN